MKGLCHVELAETSENRASHRRVGNGFENHAALLPPKKETTDRTDFTDKKIDVTSRAAIPEHPFRVR